MPPEGRNPSGRGPRRDRGRSQDVVADADTASRHSAVFDPSGDLTKIPEELHSDASAVSTLPDAEGKTEPGVEKNPKAEEASALAAPAGKMFSMAEPFDYLLMAVGSIGAFGHGLVLPGLMIVFGGMVNALGEYRGDPDENSKMAARIAHLSIFSFAFACSTIVTSTLQVGCWIYTGERQAVKLRSQLLRAVLRQDVGYFDTESQTAAIVGHISSDIAIIQDGTSDKIGHLVQHMSTFISGLAVGFIYAWKLSLLTVATVPAIALVGAVYNKVAVSLSAESQEAYGQATSVVEQAVTQIRAVYSYVEESSAIKALSRALESTVSIGTRAGLAKGLGIGSLTAAVNCSWSLLLWYAGVLVSKGESTGGRVITAVFSIIFGGMSLGIAAPDFQAFAQARVVAYKIFLLLDRKPLVEEAENAKRLKKVTGRIEFSKVSFAYPSRPESLVLNNLSLHVPAGKVVALVGGSGSGKSTVISLIERFYDPTAGEILLDGVDTKQLQLKWLRNQIGLVSQEPSLFATSIRDNIAYGKAAGSAEATVTDDAIEGAAKAANAHSFITKLPLGYQSQVGERGFQLSGGQKQRLAIARAILRNPTILLLDEATSALDTESERVVQEALDSLMLGRTTLVVAHRLATIRNADMIAVMQLGQLVELGSHKELMEIDNGVYKAMVLTQQNAGDMAPRRVAQSPARHSFSQHSSLAGSPAHGYGQPARRSFAGSSGLAPPRRSFAAASPLPGYSPSAFVSRMSPAPAMPFSPASISVADFSMAFSPGSMTPSHRRRMSLAESEMQEKPAHRYSGLELEAEKEDAYGGGHEPQGKSASLLLRLFRLSLPSWPYTVLGSIGSVIAGAMMPLFIYYLFEVTVAFFDPDTDNMKRTIRKWIIVYALLGIGSLLGNALEHYSFGRVGEAVTKGVQEDMFAAMLDFEVGWFDQEENNSGAILSRFSSDAMSIKTAVADRAAQVMQNLAGFTVAIVVGLFTEWHMVLLAIGCLPFYLFGGITMIQSMSGFSGKLSKQHEEANKVAAEAVNNFRTVISFSAEDQVMGRFNKVLEGPTKKGLGRSAKVGAIFGFSQFSLHASSALSLWFCSVLVQKKLSSFLHALQTFQSLSQTAYSLAEVMTLLPAMVQAGQALASVLSIIDRQRLRQQLEGMDSESAGSKGKKKLSEVKSHIQPSDVQLGNSTRPDVLSKGKKKLSEVKGHIQLFDVQLSYPTRPDVLVLRGLSLKIQAGRTTALVGESGSGKSSVIALIERFYEPSFGYLTLDGRDISTLDVRWLRAQIGLVQQEPALFQMSIRDNILYGCGEAGKAEAEVVAAAKMANAHAFISALPQGYHTPVGTRGVQLSGGQKQRIAIARAVLKAPKILLLDEATSALDVESERLVQEALWQLMSSGRHTTVVVAHRLSTVRNSNAIAVLRDGVLDQIGTHDDLMASKGTYARLVGAQT